MKKEVKNKKKTGSKPTMSQSTSTSVSQLEVVGNERSDSVPCMIQQPYLSGRTPLRSNGIFRRISKHHFGRRRTPV